MEKYEPENKEKIRQLEREIKKMQRDHARTFGYDVPEKRSTQIAEAIIFVVGAAFLAVGLLWLFKNISVATSLAILKIGRIRFSRSIFALPLIIGIVSFMLSSQKKIPLIITASGLAAAFIGLIVNMDFSVIPESTALCIIMPALTVIGLLLTIITLFRVFSRKHIQNND